MNRRWTICGDYRQMGPARYYGGCGGSVERLYRIGAVSTGNVNRSEVL